jgi:cell wall-associated NlpC family hydrolase
MSDAKRVQGTASDIGDLTLRSGRTVKDVAIVVGGGITPTPMLTRTTEGASTVAVPIYDPNLSFLQHSLLAEKFDAELDGLHFRYVGLSKTGKNLSLTLEDRDVAKIRELTGPKRAFREPNGAGSKGTTRAEFVKSLVNEANPSLDFFCPQLHAKQPIEKKAQGAKAKEESKANRGKGVGASGGKVKGHAADAEQTEMVDRALRVAESLSAPLKARVALVAALIDESECRNTHSGTGSSVGVLQLLAEHGSLSERLDVEHCVHLFLTEGFTGAGGAIKLSNAHPTWSAAEVANQVQGPAAGASVYAPYQTEAREWVEGFEGGETSGSIEVTEPYEFKVGANETYWAAIQRLAKEVNWRAFIVAGRFFFIDEIELIRGEVRLAIDQDTEGIETVDFEYDTGMPVTEVTVTARVKKWGVPPGAVVTVAGYGPASFGSGDAPPKDKKAPAIASAVKAATHEGKGRYLVTSIESPLGGDTESRLATVTLKKPTAPLPEPAATTKTVEGLAALEGSAAGTAPAQEMLRAAEAEAAKQRRYLWDGGHDALFTGPYDCSGFVSFLLHVGGFLNAPTNTTGLAAWGEAGAGSEITVYVKTSGDSEEEHTAIKIGKDVFESGGGGENTNPNGGAGHVDPSQVKTFLTQFNVKRHPKGF